MALGPAEPESAEPGSTEPESNEADSPAPERAGPAAPPASALEVVIFAGPNGAGKTTFASTHLRNRPEITEYLNADLIAGGISPSNPEAVAVQAGRMLLAEIARLTDERRSFGFETTLSGRNYLRHIDRWHDLGYTVSLRFLSLPSADDAVRRVRFRVSQGGHHIPEEVIRRRFDSGLANFHEVYADRVDAWTLYDNSGSAPVILDSKPLQRRPDEQQQ